MSIPKNHHQSLFLSAFFMVFFLFGLGGVTIGCFSTPSPACSFQCGPSGECPSGYLCRTDGFCKRSDVADNFVCQIDAAPPIDATIDAAVDAVNDADVSDAPTTD